MRLRHLGDVRLGNSINLLFQPPALLIILQESPQGEEEGDLLPADDRQLVMVNSLTTSQQQDLQQLL